MTEAPPVDPRALLVVRLRGYDREAELAYFDDEGPRVLTRLREALPGGDHGGALVEVFRAFRVAVGHARGPEDLDELLALAEKKVHSAREFAEGPASPPGDDALLAGVRAVLAHDPRPRVFTAAAERARFRARMLFLLLVAALGLVAHRAIKARRDARLRALGELPAQTTR